MIFRQNFRDLTEWSKQGLAIKSTGSNEAVKLYDSALTQYIGWYDDNVGLAFTINQMLESDSDFGQTMALGLDLIGSGTSIRHDPKLKTSLDQLKCLAEKRKSEIDWRETKHVEAIDLFANGHWSQATKVWEQILAQHPNDLLALKFAHDAYFYLGDKQNLLSSIERVYGSWEKNLSDPLQAYIHGMYAFGLEESKNYSSAEKQAVLGLEKIPHDGWATHALAHVYEMQHRTSDGLTAYSTTMDNWYDCNYLACHNIWHWALFHIENNEPEMALKLYDSEIGPRVSKPDNAMLDIVDACSLLYRLDLLFPKQRYTSQKQWQDLYQACEPHFNDNILGFNQCHFAMACLGCDRTAKVEELLESLTETKIAGYIGDHWYEATEQVLQSMIDFKREQYQKATDRLLKIRDRILLMGGSDAQRDVFDQLLLVSAMQTPSNTDLCRTLVNERKQRLNSGRDDVVIQNVLKVLKEK